MALYLDLDQINSLVALKQWPALSISQELATRAQQNSGELDLHCGF